MTTLLEESLVATALGIRFWDPVQAAPISDHLSVVAVRAGGTGQPTPAVRTRSGAYVFHGLEGLNFPSLPESPGPAADAVEFLVDVADALGRYHAMRFRVPVPHRGLWEPTLEGSPAVGGPGAFLLSTATRTPPAGTARVRADLWDATNGRAAAFALLEIQISGLLWYGMADRQGRAAVLFPYPRPELVTGSPPPPQPITEATWEMEIAVSYHPDLGPSVAEDEPPEQDVVRSQPAARIYPESLSSPPPADETLPFSLEESLAYGADLILRSGDESRLYLSPSGLSP